MSEERAYVNCRRCYDLAEEIRRGSESTASRELSEHRQFEKEVLHSDQLYAARNEALRALEQAGGRKAKRARKACMNCTYVRNRIIDVLSNLNFQY